MSTLRIASTQFELRAESSLDTFAQHVNGIVAAAAADGAQLVLLPELVTTGLLASHRNSAELDAAHIGDVYRTLFPLIADHYVDLMSSIAKRHNIIIGGASNIRRLPDDSLRNTAYLFHPNGNVDSQDKLHLTPPERAMGITAGDTVTTVEIEGFTVALQICADIEFPEVSRHLALEGTNLILAPSLTWNSRGANRVRYGAHARAMENQLYVAVSPLVGSNGIPQGAALHCTGYAMVTTPLDRTFGINDGVLAAHEDNRREGFIIADLDLALVEASRANPEPPGLKYVRSDFYEALRSGESLRA
ncbi:Predicted amidohydrolase [Arthrobacter sp. 49Tsu3.1M3]|uniref:nitrilase-related carbon-nitrogen hydrolase n=1 Tax=Arthrobacter sp. 49Tsu3.1M3 TaxID=1279029 RepID=UPI0009A799BB|nr:nitrilase-related carbon-nitrogen hydrolase [Arthrobacter sp. 49Tsu3.1M3]SKB44012.1 Predicted amidohydrolase [Arthrobacter sp. 49Tsu3.1M3]